MAVTKIWPIKDSLRRVVDYARNPAKTEYTDLQTVLHYTANGEKTEHGTEKTMYVTGINCSRDRVFQEMYAVQERFGKTGGNVAYHAYQSFKPGEVTPELCHQMGVELAKRMWGEDRQVLVATHFNTGTYHNHLVISSVNMWDGRKFDCSKRAYYELRRLSDELCEEHGLSVIRAPGSRTPRSIYFAEKNGEPTRYNLMRQSIDEAAAIARTQRDFAEILRLKGYTVQMDERRKYFTICSLGSKKPMRMARLGEGYDNKSILNRIYLDDSPARFRGNREFWLEQHERLKSKPEKVRLSGSMHRVKKVTGLRALYLHYCYLLGYLPRKKPYKPLSPEMREGVHRLFRGEHFDLGGVQMAKGVHFLYSVAVWERFDICFHVIIIGAAVCFRGQLNDAFFHLFHRPLAAITESVAICLYDGYDEQGVVLVHCPAVSIENVYIVGCPERFRLIKRFSDAAVIIDRYTISRANIIGGNFNMLPYAVILTDSTQIVNWAVYHIGLG